MEFIAPQIQWAALTPLFVVFGGAILGVLVETFISSRLRRRFQIVISLLTVAAAFVTVVWRWSVVTFVGPQKVFDNAFVEDGPALAAQTILLIITFMSLLLISERSENGDGFFAAQVATKPGSKAEAYAEAKNLAQTEVFPLTLFSLGGMLIFPAANNLLTLFVALEVISLPLYVLCATARKRRELSQEAALKYFTLGAFASAFFIFGVAMLYGYSGSIAYERIYQAVPAVAGLNWLLLAGVIFVLVGLLFKVGAVPFHAWTPDVYQGAPTPVTGFMAAATKLAAFAALLRFIYVAVPGVGWDLMPLAWVIIIATMFLGTLLGIAQTNVKRLLAYSSIAHAGFILIAVFALQPSSISAILFYLFAYGIATVGAFGVVALVRQRSTDGKAGLEAQELSQWTGLGKKSPVLATCMCIFLLSFAGIPLTSGFLGKFLVFKAGIEGHLTVLVVLAVLASAITAFFYFRLLVRMFFMDPATDGDGKDVVVVASDGTAIVAIVVAAIVTIVAGIFPGPILDLLHSSAVFFL